MMRRYQVVLGTAVTLFGAYTFVACGGSDGGNGTRPPADQGGRGDAGTMLDGGSDAAEAGTADGGDVVNAGVDGEGGADEGGSQPERWVRWPDQGTLQHIAKTADGSLLGVAHIVDIFGPADFGGEPLTALGGRDIVVFKYAADGTHVYSKRFGGPGHESAAAVALGPSHEIYVAGYSPGNVDFENSTTDSANGVQGFLLKLDADANVVWSKSWGGATNQDQGTAAAVSAAGRVVVAGHFSASVDFGGGPLVSSGVDLFMAAFDAVGNHIYSRNVSSTSEPNNPFPEGTIADIAVDEEGKVYFVGGFKGSLDLGLSSAGGSDALFVKLDEGGNVAWAKSHGSSQEYEVFPSVALRGTAEVVVGGAMTGAVDLGGGTPGAAGAEDVVVARFAPDGSHLSSRRFGDGHEQQLTDVDVRDDGWVIVAGMDSGELAFDTLTLTIPPTTSQGAFCFVLDATNTGVAGAAYNPSDNGAAHLVCASQATVASTSVAITSTRWPSRA